MTEINEWKYLLLSQLRISLVNNTHVRSSYTRNDPCRCLIRHGHLIVHHVLYVMSCFNFYVFIFSSFATGSSLKSDKSTLQLVGNFQTNPLTG